MIAQLRGKIVDAGLEKDSFRVVLDVNGVGYEVLAPRSAEGTFSVGQSTTMFISESVTAFDGRLIRKSSPVRTAVGTP